jgi:hypothetical protein
MKKTAILVVLYDTISKKYETDLTYCHKHDKVNNELYTGNNSKVIIELIKFGYGQEQINELIEIEKCYKLKNNNENT